MKPLLKHILRRGQTGQTIVILALGFIVLLGFVGIVTDVSLLFVRYSTLRRAVDSAAVAAAGQVRRYVPTAAELAQVGGDPNKADGLAYARNLTTVNLAARQFIEFYGLSPSNVVVETYQSLDCANHPERDPELCNPARKLGRVTAQVPSPTVFLRLLGWGTVQLEAVATSETAVLDVVLLFDVSESMLDNTTYDDWDNINLGARIIPPRMDKAIEAYVAADPVNNTPVKFIQSILKLPFNQVIDNAYIKNTPNAFRAFIDPNNNNTFTEVPLNHDQVPRKTCQIRFWPSGRTIPNADGSLFYQHPDVATMGDDVWQEYAKFLGDPSYPRSYSNFVPAYNFYGCCNDPNGDGNFSDLICQPFRQARDASLEFIKQIDFARGDRVAIVTFDRSASLLQPEHPAGTDVSPMIETYADAVNILNKAVGVRAEETFYDDSNNDGLWDGYVTNFGDTVVYRTVDTGNPKNDGYTYWDTAPVGTMVDYPVKSSCPYVNAALVFPNSLYSAETSAQNPYRYPNSLAALVEPIMHPNLNDPAWKDELPPEGIGVEANYTYERRASCAGTNMGAALRTGNNALLDPDTVRTNGAVWVMVMLSDGAAGASDPANRWSLAEAGRFLTEPNPYNGTADLPLTDPQGRFKPIKGDYGVFGVCPYGTDTNPAELVEDESGGFPYCGDLVPESRHFCFDPVALDRFGFSVNLDNPNCDEEFYDADDYARDWADHVGLLDPYPYLGNAVESRSDALLPTIFTIGFNLTFSDLTTMCKDGLIFVSAGDNDYESCLGEELLRYIADVGDNQQVDTDYQQDWRDNGQPDLNVSDWGVRGPCEDPIPGFNNPAEVKNAGQPFSTIIQPRKPGENCGNYFNATDGLELQRVFDEIAARMFTRLAR
ncbi:MAG: hypothetical protein HZC41_13680 [Chloroflexi bacterium]|nr:hypothetical protein [Chloroflexota bacterium]